MRPLHVKPCLPSSTPPPLPNSSTQSSCPYRPHHAYLSSFCPLINREDNLSPLQRQNILFGDMAEYHPQYLQLHQPDQQLRTRHVVKAATAVTAGGSLLVLSALTLAGTVVALIVATPLMVIFSPVLIPAVIATGLLVTGFLTSGGFGIAAVTVLSWIYRYMTGKHPPGTDQLDQARLKLASKAREMKDRVEQFGHQHLTTTTTTTQ